MSVEDIAVFSLSSVLFTLCCFEFSICSGEASFNSVVFFGFKRVFRACVESCSPISADHRREFELSGTLCNFETLHAIFGSSAVLISFSDRKERCLCISLPPPLKIDLFPASSEFDVWFNIFRSSAIVFNVPASAGSFPHCIMGNGDTSLSRSSYVEKIVK